MWTNLLTNPDFETYTTTPGAPDGWTYNQGGTGGKAEKETTTVFRENNSCKITKSNSGWSVIYQTIAATPYRGKVVTFSGWVKSANTTANAVVLNMYTDGLVSYGLSYYQNSGNWEHLVCSFTVDSGANNLSVLLGIDSTASTVVYFDFTHLINNIIGKINGVPAGNIKSINGILVANIAKINGVVG